MTHFNRKSYQYSCGAISIILILLSCLGCSPVPNNEAIAFSDSSFKRYDLQGEEILKEELAVIYLHVVDTLLLVEFLQKKDWAYKVYGAKSLSYIGNLGRIGDGPNEWKNPRFSGQIEKSGTSLGLWLNDIGHRRFQMIDVYKSIDQPEPVISFSKKYPPSLKINQRLFYLNPSQWIGNSGPESTERGQLLIYDPLSDSSELVPFNINVTNSELLSAYEKYNAYFSYISLKPDKTKLVSAMNHLSKIDIFDLKDKPILQSTIVSKDEKNNDLNGELIKKDPSYLSNYYMWLSTTDKYIYALYHGQSSSNYSKDLIPTEIRVFNWEGNPIAQLNIPEYLLTFSVDEDNGFIYGVSFFQEKAIRYPFSLDE